MAELVFRLQAAPGHEHVGDAHAGRLPERSSHVVFIIPLQKRTVNDVEDVALVFLPVLGRQAVSDSIELLNEQWLIRAILIFQHGGHVVHVAIFHTPDVRAAGIRPAACVGYVEHIADAGRIPAGVNQGNAFGAAPHIPAHGVRPQPVLRAGRRVGPLGEDHELFRVRIFVNPRRRGQEGSPLLIAAAQSLCRVLGHLRVSQCFVGHIVSVFPPFL